MYREKKSNSGGHNNRKFNSVKFLMFPITTNCPAWLVQCLTREKRDNRRHSTTSFCQNVSGNKVSKVSSFIILLSGEGLNLLQYK